MAQGTLRVGLEVDYWFLREKSAIEIRDSQFRVVDVVQSGAALKLAPGLYEVSAVLEDGQKYRKMIHLEVGSTVDVKLKSNETNAQLASIPMFETFGDKGLLLEVLPDAALPARWDASPDGTGLIVVGAPLERHGYGRRTDRRQPDGHDDQMLIQLEHFGIPELQPITFPDTLRVLKQTELDKNRVMLHSVSTGAALHSQGGNFWIFVPTTILHAVPEAVLQIGIRKYFISLPVNPYANDPKRACELYVEDNGIAIRAQVWTDPSRTLVNSLLHMLASGHLMNAIDIAQKGANLLLDKYQDPAGAALGGLLLNKVGELKRNQDWLENLARDFAWLPDGKVLLALVLMEDEGTEDRCIELLEKACQQRMLFTESYSLLLKLLRTWPFERHADRCRVLLRSLARVTPYVDWSSITFSHWDLDED